MPSTKRFWIAMTLFQAAFGVAVFALTRLYYLPAPRNVESAAPLPSLQLPWPEVGAGGSLAPQASAVLTDPVEISRRADELYRSQQYEQAALLYEQLLTFDASNIDVINNLGIALHEAGRSAEALEKLNAGVVSNPTHQRIWLTLGFVNAQLGNTQQARLALTNASQVGTNEEIRRSAQAMLAGLP